MIFGHKDYYTVLFFSGSMTKCFQITGVGDRILSSFLPCF